MLSPAIFHLLFSTTKSSSWYSPSPAEKQAKKGEVIYTDGKVAGSDLESKPSDSEAVLFLLCVPWMPPCR